VNFRKKKQETLYAAEKGREALERQQAAAAARHWCCSAPINGPHALACENYERRPLPDVAEGQLKIT
jgi:hypothetical protein